MGTIVDMAGQRFRYLLVLGRGEVKVSAGGGRHLHWICLCDCGHEVSVRGTALRNGSRGSCGCKAREMAAKSCTKHGHTKNHTQSQEYQAWSGILQRCNNPSMGRAYAEYGGRGIKVCERWLTFANFLEDMGLKPSPKLSIDRINVNGNYEKANCRWATRSEQQSNKRKIRAIGNFSDEELRQECLRRGWKL